ncbi:MAG: chromosome segregation protein SMC [Clostridia bacterium]|nr:chromosome segregation protein SMC [Clostridia bacterium]
MNFNKIELIGFKSFADKQEIQFDNGVTCIVGPNGCGKSNVADAVRWVLGEQSAKTLRGSSMQDVIFNGTQNRKSLSYCEVSLFFDNTNKIFKDLDYTEVQFTRKLFRSGESEYYINKKQARLRDIIDLLHECGVSKEGYTIIGQGKVSEILSAKPEDRRAIFEEAVGIAKTKAKRLETVRKLERTRDNITRIVDITTELERQLEPLGRQAEKTRAYRALSEDLKYHEVNAYLYKYNNAASVKENINLRIKGITEQTEIRSRELETAIKNYNAHQREINSADETIRQLNEELIEKTQAFERQSGAAKVYGEKISFFRSEIKRLSDEIEAAAKKSEELISKINKNEEYANNCREDVDRLTVRSNEINAELMRVISEINEGEKKAMSAQEAILKSVETFAALKENKGALSSEKSIYSERQADTLEKVKTLSEKLAALMAENSENAVEMSKLDKSAQRAKEDIKDKEDDIASTNNLISDIDNKTYTLHSTISALEANKRFYSNLKDSFDGYQSSVKRLMQAAKDNREISMRVKGLLANLIKTDAKYDVAIETCLGGAVQNVVTATPDDAQYLIQYLKRTEGGRVTFLPVSSMKPRYETSETRRALSENGALGLANELVTYDKYYDNVIRFLLGNTLIVDNIDNAVAIAKKYRFAFKIVTLDGDQLSSSGSMSGGSRRQNTSNLLSIDRKIEEITAELETKTAEMARHKARKEQLVLQVTEARKELASLNAFLQDVRQKAVALREKIAAVEIQIADVTKEIEGNKDVIAFINTKLSEINKAYTDIELGSEKLERERESASSDADKSRSEFDEHKKRRDELIEENTQVQARLAYLNSEIKATEEANAGMHAELQSLAGVKEKNSATIDSDNIMITNLLAEVEKVAFSEAEQQYLSSLREKRTATENRKAALGEEVRQDNLRREMLQAEIDKLNARKYNEEVALSKVDSELEYMQQRILEAYDITYETALPLLDENYDINNSAAEIASLKRKIGALGTINPNAIDDFNELNERYQEMVAQRDDLTNAEDNLKSVIAQLTEEMSTIFSTGFATIRQNFTRIFKELFGGGTADLVLEQGETDDPLEQGIEIVAEPPGKKLQKISLLSGGEMALTAIAILFAILRLRPMPFVVLDEIEAALDDANVERFARYLKNFSQETQFVVITHKKVTMELGDALYGVTMPEKGVSKIVSVKLADVADTLGA